MKIHSDDRRVAWLEVFGGSNMPGDLSVTWVHPGAICAWHRHERQDDWMLVVQGTLKVGLWKPSLLPQWQTLTPFHPVPLVIPAGSWHGYQNIGSEDALLVTYITQHYDPEDEHRLSPVLAGVSWERIPR